MSIWQGFLEALQRLFTDSGFSALGWQNYVMIAVACVLMYLAIKKDNSLWLWGNHKNCFYADGQEDEFFWEIAQNVKMAETNGWSICYLTKDNKMYMIEEGKNIEDRKLVSKNVTAITNYEFDYYFIKTNGNLYESVGNKNKKIFKNMDLG